MAAGSQISDDQLLERSRQGDAAAFAEIYRRQHRAVFHFTVHMTGSPGLAEEVTQEVFMALMRDSGKYDPTRGVLQAYLLGMARKFVLRILKRERAYLGMAEDAEENAAAESRETWAAAPDNLINGLAREETIRKVRQTVLALPAHYREVTVLCDLQELSYNEAAAVLGLAAGTVRSRLHRARAMLLERLLPLREAAASTLGQD